MSRSSSNSRQTDLAITGWGLASAAGDQAFALLGAVGCGLNLARPDPILEAPARDGQGAAAIMTCPSLAQDAEAAERMRLLWQTALDALLDDWTDAPERLARMHLILLVPDVTTERGSELDAGDWPSLIAGRLGHERPENIEVRPVREDVTAAWLEVAERLEDETCEGIVLGVVDTLLDPASLMALAAEHRLLLEGDAEGFAPGEAAAFVVLERAAAAGPRTRARLRAIARLPEPEHGRIGETRLNALSQAIGLAAAEAGATVGDIDCLCATVAGGPGKEVEWFQAAFDLWPVRLDEAERLAMQNGDTDMPPQPPPAPEPERLDPALLLGETGHAGLLLSVLCACARFDFVWPAVRNVLVAELPDAPWRGALWLEAVREAGVE